MVANPIWIAGYGGTPTGGASPVWIVGYGGAIAGAAESWIAGYGGTPAAGASPVWVAGYGGTPTGGASPIWIGGYLTSGIGVLPGSPVNTVAPVASGTLTVGSTLSCTTGTWTNSPTSYAYQWLRNGGGISGATSSTYVTVTADGGTSVSCRVTATNAIGPGLPATSNALAIAAVSTTSVWSAADAAGNGMTLSNGGLTVTPTALGNQTIRGTNSHSTGKYYVEMKAATLPNGTSEYGPAMADAGFSPPTTYAGNANYSLGAFANPGTFVASTGFTFNVAAPTHTAVAGDVYQIAVDLDAGKIWFGFNNTWAASGVPAAGTTPTASIVSPALGLALFPAFSFTSAASIAGSWTLQSQPAQQTYLPPPGFQAWDGGPVTPSTSVWSASDASANSMTLTNGGLTVTASTSAAWQTVRGTTSKTSGKVYVEFAASGTLTDNANIFGLASSGITVTTNIGNSNYSGGPLPGYALNEVSAGFTSNYAPPNIQPHVGDVWALAVDFTAGNIWIAQNNVWLNSSSPATGTLPIISFVAATVGALFPGMSLTIPADGTWTLQPTAASQKYAPPAGFSPWDGAGGHSAQAVAYLARTVGGNEGGNGTNIANLIDGLVADGVWSKLDALYVLAQQNVTDALLNLVGTSYGLTNINANTFTTYVGYSGFNGTGGYLNSGLNVAAGGLNYTQNSASMGAWAYAVISEAAGEISDGANLSLYNNYTGGLFFARVNDLTAGSVPTVGTNGLYIGDRSSSTTVVPYWNGTAQTSVSSASTALVTGTFKIGLGGSGTSAETLSAAFIGGSLGSAGQLALYNRLRTYMTAVGVP